MKDRPVPTVDDLKSAALSDSLTTVLELATSDLIIFRTLASVGQATCDLRLQVEATQGSQDELSLAIVEAHLMAELLLARCAEAAHLIVKAKIEREARRESARYN